MSSIYQLYRLDLSENQKANLANAYQNKTGYTLRLTNRQLKCDDEIRLTQSQIKKIQKAQLLKKGIEIKISRTQAMKGGSIFSLLAGLATKAIGYYTKGAIESHTKVTAGRLKMAQQQLRIIEHVLTKSGRPVLPPALRKLIVAVYHNISHFGQIKFMHF